MDAARQKAIDEAVVTLRTCAVLLGLSRAEIERLVADAWRERAAPAPGALTPLFCAARDLLLACDNAEAALKVAVAAAAWRAAAQDSPSRFVGGAL